MIFEIINKFFKVFYGRGLGKYKIFKPLVSFHNYIYNKYKKKSNNKIISLKDFKIYLNPNSNSQVDKEIIMTGSYEKNLINLIKKNMSNDGIFVDVGANIGLHSLSLSKYLSKGKIYSFEPVTVTYNKFIKNIELNKFKNIIPLKFGVSDKNNKIKINFDLEDLGRSSIVEKLNLSQSEEIELISLDKYFNKNQKIDFIKIDIEGNEFDALKGMNNLLMKNKNIKIIFEFSPIIYKNKSKNLNKYLTSFLNFLIQDCNFNIYEIKNKNLGKLKLVKIVDINKFILINKDNSTNLFCRRE